MYQFENIQTACCENRDRAHTIPMYNIYSHCMVKFATQDQLLTQYAVKSFTNLTLNVH